ncbi:hypothetical protein BS78_07G141200 [Paspalum vaginatum]|nr:hypothetical protein BS78_07G141200 [Paspalum vaginatum]
MASSSTTSAAGTTDAVSETSLSFSPTRDIQLLVRNINSQTTIIQARPEDTLDAVINRIDEATAYRSDLCAVYAGRELPLEATINELRLPSDGIIHLTCRLRSTLYPDAWNLMSQIMDAGCLTAATPSPATAEAFGKLIMSFWDTALAADKKHPLELMEPIAEYLSIFFRSGVAKMLGQFYLSHYAPHHSVAEQAIRYFVSINGLIGSPSALVWIPSVLMELCRSMDVGARSNGGTLCDDLRGILVRILSKASNTQPRIPDMSHDWAAEQMASFTRDAAHAVMAGILAEEWDSTVLGRTLSEFIIFWRTLRHEVRELQAKSPRWWGCCAGAEQKIPWMAMVSLMLESLLECVEGCMKRFEMGLLCLSRPATSRQQPPKWTTSSWCVVWSVLNEVQAWSELEMWGVQRDLRHKLHGALAAHSAAVTALVVSVERNWIVNIHWISRHRDILEFQARRHLAITMLPNLETGINMPIPHMVRVHRSRLLLESFENIAQATRFQLHAGLFVEFKHEEATGPGVMREWFCLVCQALFNPLRLLFMACPRDRRRFFLNPTSDLDPLHMELFFFSGRMIGLSLMHNIQVGVFLDRTLFLLLTGKEITLDDIVDADPSLHTSCKKILEMDAGLIDSDALGLTFSREAEVSGLRTDIEFFPGGKDVTITSKNRREYVRLLIQHSFMECTRCQLSNFSAGLRSMLINGESLDMFLESLDDKDFDQMLGGRSSTAIDVEEWISHTEYSGYRAEDCQISWFWKVVERMAVQQQQRLLFFWTAMKCLPFDGFSGLESKLCIFRASSSCDHLPTSSTCFYQLRLPAYISFDIMHSRLQMIVQEHMSSSFGEV